METLRAFVGCLLDLAASRKLVELTAALRRAADERGLAARWVPPPNLHVTLKFLGAIDAGLVPALGDALAVVAAGHPAPRLRLRGLGVFPAPSEGPPRVLFARVVEGADALGAVAQAVDAGFEALGLAREARAYTPHVTLARLPEGLAPAALDDIVRAASRHHDAGPATLGALTLYRSDRPRAGVEYHALARYPFAPPPRPARGK